MDEYTGFAEVYDELMEDVPYAEWCDRIISILREHGINDGLVLDLGCGSGIMTEMLADAGYDMTGIDLSPEMLEKAKLKKELSGNDILYLCQDMRSFELYGTVRAIVCVCDSLNYILEAEELKHVFELVNNYLDPGGLFLFDINTVHKYRDVIGDMTIAENREDCSFIWENYYDEDSGVNEYDLTLFIQKKNESGEESGQAEAEDIYRKYEETHFQRGYEPEQIEKMLKEAGLEFIEAFDGEKTADVSEKMPVTRDSERVFFIARECMKHK